jgi:N-acetylglucosamine-6-phosphate deacetylase
VTIQAIFADRAFTPAEEIADAVILLAGEKIAAIGPRGAISVPRDARRCDARGLTIVPGFIDLHIHGAGGRDIMEGTREALEIIAATAASRGTTSLVATTVTASEECTLRATSAISGWIHSGPASETTGVAGGLTAEIRAEILGIHFEGPFISAARRGVHPLEWIAPPSIPRLRDLLAAAQGTARILTLAPELPGALDLVHAARNAGLIVSLGHTDATYAQAMAAINLGARHATHVFNAMRPFAHRETGVLGATLTCPLVACELIADGVHVDPAAIRLLIAAKGAAGIILVSDATSATGMPDGRYALGSFEVNVVGGVSRDSAGNLAGSTLTLDRALRHLHALGVPLPEVLAMLTANPARALGLDGRKGALVPGANADLVFLDERLEVAGVMTRGLGGPNAELTRA